MKSTLFKSVTVVALIVGFATTSHADPKYPFGYVPSDVPIGKIESTSTGDWRLTDHRRDSLQ